MFKKLIVYAAFIIAALAIFTVIFAYAIVPYDPNEIDLLAKFEPASLKHLLGTDHLGATSLVGCLRPRAFR